MDGGRVLRAFLACWTSYGQATRIAAAVGQLFAVIFGLVGFFTNPLLILIAVFVWFGASQEAAATLMKLSFAGIPVRKLMLTDFHSLREGDTLARAVELLLAGTQHDFPVLVDGNQVTGLLTRTDLISALSKRGPECTVAEAMRRDYRTLDASDPLESALMQTAGSQEYVIPVTEAGRLVGLLTSDNLAEFFMLRTALEQSRRHPHAA
jgi:CBS-domain-containing membrane protein